MVRIPDNREAESRKSPEYQGKTAQKLAQYGITAGFSAGSFGMDFPLCRIEVCLVYIYNHRNDCNNCELAFVPKFIEK